MGNRLFRMITLGIRQFRDPYYQGFAAQIAFYYLLSMVPMVMLLSQLMMSIFQTTIADAVGWLLDALGGAYSDEVKDMLTYRSAGALNIVYAVIALWAALYIAYPLVVTSKPMQALWPLGMVIALLIVYFRMKNVDLKEFFAGADSAA